MKIVKKAKDPNDEDLLDYDKDSVSSLDDDQSTNKNKNRRDSKYVGNLVKDNNTVIEVNEDDEHSPSVRRSKSKTK